MRNILFTFLAVWLKSQYLIMLCQRTQKKDDIRNDAQALEQLKGANDQS